MMKNIIIFGVIIFNTITVSNSFADEKKDMYADKKKDMSADKKKDMSFYLGVGIGYNFIDAPSEDESLFVIDNGQDAFGGSGILFGLNAGFNVNKYFAIEYETLKLSIDEEFSNGSTEHSYTGSAFNVVLKSPIKGKRYSVFGKFGKVDLDRKVKVEISGTSRLDYKTDVSGTKFGAGVTTPFIKGKWQKELGVYSYSLDNSKSMLGIEAKFNYVF